MKCGGILLAIIDVIKFDGIANRNWLVYRYPGESFVIGTQLIVGEGQIAVFVKGGKALDYFSAGTHTLHANNIPLLQSVINLPFGRRTPFTAEVIFINKTVKLDILWGTSDPISLIDPKYNVLLRVRAFGQFGIRISDFRVFLTELIGALGERNIVKYDTVIQYFKGITVTKVKTIIANTIINKKISALEISPQLELLSEAAEKSISQDFDRFGIEVINFNLTSVNFPEEDFETINNILSEKAAFDIIGDNRYNVKRSFDVMESAAGNESGNIASTGIGLGLGAGAGLAVGNMFGANMGRLFDNSMMSQICRKCSTPNDMDDKFCGNCGEKLIVEKTKCPSCQTQVECSMKFCPECGQSMQEKECPNCHHKNEPGTKFCSECGTKQGG
ncbi:SPFH domain-containing protein [Paenibacillus sp. HB172176]|uniref:SPFH domain-containing protein n=1 Tax=Paenibacillus sp. HB172176 TaxID=2493690 RepID=UPI00198159D0|nr:SPFH domain-containing protein [Paenibacillus sp. HB172176]